MHGNRSRIFGRDLRKYGDSGRHAVGIDVSSRNVKVKGYGRKEESVSSGGMFVHFTCTCFSHQSLVFYSFAFLIQ